MFNELEITGRVRTHVVQHDAPRFAAHPDVAAAFLRLRAAATRDGKRLSSCAQSQDPPFPAMSPPGTPAWILRLRAG